MKQYTLAFLIAFCAIAQDHPQPLLTARELFYSAADTPTPPRTTPKTNSTKKKPANQVASTKPSTTTPTNPAVNVAVSQPPASDSARIVPAVMTTAPQPTAGPALGMKYTILRRTGGEMVEVAPDSVFHAEDRIQFSVETNGPGYLYIVSQGTSGQWQPMFPSSEVEAGSNKVDGFRAYTMPPKSRLVFDQQAGIEKIFIVFSRLPEQDLENVMYSLRNGGAKPAPEAKPAQERSQSEPKQLLMATIDDGTVGRLRNTYSRDLIIERVDDNTPGDKKEKAVYVVNPTGSRDSRVVADLELVHK
jgi:hypothetical protein